MRHEKIFSYNKYNIELYADDDDDVCGVFELLAICQKTGKHMYITNLDFIVQEFVRSILPDEEVDGTNLVCHDKGDFERLVEHAVNMLSDSDWCQRYLEPILDLDIQLRRWDRGLIYRPAITT